MNKKFIVILKLISLLNQLQLFFLLILISFNLYSIKK